MKKILALLAVLIFSISLVCSCGKDKGGQSSKSSSIEESSPISSSSTSDTSSLSDVSDTSSSSETSSIPSSSGSSDTSDGEALKDATEIKTESDLKNIKNGLSGKYYLANDITLTEPFVTLGSYEQPFSGYFSGNGHTISGMNVTSNVFRIDGSSLEYYAGMFACVTGTVEKLKLTDFSVTLNSEVIASTDYAEKLAENETAVLSGAVAITDFDIHAGVVGNNKGVLNEITVTAEMSIKPATDTARIRAGVIAGKNSGKITCCTSSGLIDAESTDGYIRAGGIVGYTNGNGKIVSCKSKASLNLKTTNGGKINAGGLIGNMECGEVYSCYAEGSVTANNVQGKKSSLGGLIGLVDNTDAYTLNLTTNVYEKSDKLIENESMGISISRSYAQGVVMENTSTKKGASGGFIGQISVYATADTKIIIRENGATGTTEGTLKKQGGFAGEYEVFDGVNSTAVTDFTSLGENYEFNSNVCKVADDQATLSSDIEIPSELLF